MNFRHEYKQGIDYLDMPALRARLSAVMERDEHAVDGKYEIRSIYFDNLNDKALREKLDGVNMREKFRIRYYNGDLSFIQLEKKSKIDGLCLKEQQTITLEEAKLIAEGDLEDLVRTNKPLLRELALKMHIQVIRPKTIVDYTREPFVYAPGNVRVTLDYNIRTGLASTDFLNPDCVTIPAGDTSVILEVKWDEYLPSIIRDIVQVPGTRTTAFSKYAACRIYG